MDERQFDIQVDGTTREEHLEAGREADKARDKELFQKERQEKKANRSRRRSW